MNRQLLSLLRPGKSLPLLFWSACFCTLGNAQTPAAPAAKEGTEEIRSAVPVAPKKTEAKPAAPAPAKPADPKPAEMKPAEAKAAAPAPAKPAETKPAEAKAAAPAPAPAKPADPKPAEMKPAEAKAAAPAPAPAKPADPKPADPKPAEPKVAAPAEAKVTAPAKPADPKPAETPKKVAKANSNEDADPLEVRPAVLKSSTRGAASVMGGSEMDIVKQLKKLSSGQIQEFATTYARLGNKTMANLLVSELFRRDSKDPVAAKLRKEVADVSLLPDDPEALKAQQLLVGGKAAEAASMLAELKHDRYAGKPFRYQQDYAYALLQSGQEAAAEAAFKELLSQTELGSDVKQDANKTLREMALETLLKRGQGALTAKDARNAMAVAEQLLKSNPLDLQGVALKAAVLSMTGQAQEAVNYLEGLKPQYTGFFPHNRPLADAYSDAKINDKARQLYQAVIDSTQDTKEDKADAHRRIKDLSRDELIVAGFTDLQKNKVNDASAKLQDLKIENANNLDVKTLEASIMTKKGQWNEARNLLEEVQKLQGATFDGAYALGEAYANGGDWRQAAHYLTVASDDVRNDAIARAEAARLGREMKARFRPTAKGVFDGQSGAEGDIYRQTVELSSGVVSEANIFFLRSMVSELSAKNAGSNGGSGTQPQVELAWRRILQNGYYAEASAGAHNDGAMYGAKFGRYEGPGYAWDVAVRKGDRATDSLELESLNGRQDALEFQMGTNFSRKFYMESKAILRSVNIDGHNIGSGFGLKSNVGYVFLEEKAFRPELGFNYFNEVSFFNSKVLPAQYEVRKAGIVSSGFIPDRINRHGVGITVAKHITPRIVGYVTAGVSYEFQGKQVEGRVGAGVEAGIGKNTTLNIGVDYTTNGNARNAGGDVLMGSIGIRHSF